MSEVSDQDFCGNTEALQADVFKALGDPTRMALMKILLEQNRPLTVTELQQKSGREFNTVSQGLAKLRSFKIVSAERKGKERLYSVNIAFVRMQLEILLHALTQGDASS